MKTDDMDTAVQASWSEFKAQFPDLEKVGPIGLFERMFIAGFYRGVSWSISASREPLPKKEQV